MITTTTQKMIGKSKISTRLTQSMKEVRKKARDEALKDATLYFLVILGSVLDDMMRDGRLASDVHRDIYTTSKDYAIQRGYIE
jgi:hypothetical protein